MTFYPTLCSKLSMKEIKTCRYETLVPKLCCVLWSRNSDFENPNPSLGYFTDRLVFLLNKNQCQNDGKNTLFVVQIVPKWLDFHKISAEGFLTCTSVFKNAKSLKLLSFYLEFKVYVKFVITV